MQPSDIPAVHRLLARQFRKHKAPVIDLVTAKTHDPFKILVGTILSARTKDEMTSAVCDRLFPVVGSLADLKRTPRRKLERLIYPVGFYRNKARHLKELAHVLEDRFGGHIPDTVEELCELPGVGRKTANLVVIMAFDKPAMCVDVHVHRISNRFGLVRTKTPLETEMALRKTVPVRYWKTWNSYLVSYGQMICTPTSPKCSECVLTAHCARVGVRRHR